MTPRELAPRLIKSATQMPVVTLTGPRQSGKTTLCRTLFPEKRYVNLEPLDTRQFALEDPRGFLAELPDGAILDEIQNVPELLSYLQADVDENPEPGRFVITGSQQLALTAAITQTLAGRTAILNLLPFSLGERRASEHWSDDLWTDIVRGSYPRIYDRGLDSAAWYADYITTYVERDVHQLKAISDLRAFRTFLALAAGRTAQELNFSSLGSDAGVSYNTAKSWLGVLEASFVVLTAPAWHRNLRKQIVKAPKLHFIGSGVLCTLLGIRQADQLRTHPLRGPIFESWVAGELVKAKVNSGLPIDLMHFRESRGIEIDILFEDGLVLHAIECKSGATAQPSYFEPLQRFADLLDERQPALSVRQALIHGGETSSLRRKVPLYGWKDVDKLGREIANVR
jgi:uncharacterized protein